MWAKISTIVYLQLQKPNKADKTTVASSQGKVLRQLQVHHQTPLSVATATTQPQDAHVSLCP